MRSNAYPRAVRWVATVTVGALLCCLAIPTLASAQRKAQSGRSPAGKALRVGARSPITAGLALGRSAQAVDLTSDLSVDTPEARGQALGKVKERLKGYSLIVADLKTAKNKKELKLITEAASETGVDVVLENVDGIGMADLYGIGPLHPASAAVVKTDPSTGKHAVYFFHEDESELSLSDVDQSTSVVEKKPPWEDRPEEDQREAERKASKEGRKPSDKPKRVPTPSEEPLRPTKKSFTKPEVSKRVDEVLRKAMPQGKSLRADIGGAPGHAVREWSMTSNDALNVGGQTLTSQTIWNLRLVASLNPAKKYLEVHTTGPGAVRTGTTKNNQYERYYYLKKWETKMSPNIYWTNTSVRYPYTPLGWEPDGRVRIDDWQPRTINRNTTRSHDVNWSFAVGAVGGGGGAGGTYTVTDTYEVTTFDFEARGTTGGTYSNEIIHTFTGSKPNLASLSTGTLCDPQLSSVPASAWDAFSPPVYGRFLVNNTESGYSGIWLQGKGTWHRAELANRVYDWTGCLESVDRRDWGGIAGFNHGVVIGWRWVDPGEPDS